MEFTWYYLCLATLFFVLKFFQVENTANLIMLISPPGGFPAYLSFFSKCTVWEYGHLICSWFANALWLKVKHFNNSLYKQNRVYFHVCALHFYLYPPTSTWRFLSHFSEQKFAFTVLSYFQCIFNINPFICVLNLVRSLLLIIISMFLILRYIYKLCSIFFYPDSINISPCVDASRKVFMGLRVIILMKATCRVLTNSKLEIKLT